MAKVPRITFSKAQSTADLQSSLLARLTVTLSPIINEVQVPVNHEAVDTIETLVHNENASKPSRLFTLQKVAMEFGPVAQESVAKRVTSAAPVAPVAPAAPVAPVANTSQAPQLIYIAQQQPVSYVAQQQPMSYVAQQQPMSYVAQQQPMSFVAGAPIAYSAVPQKGQFASVQQQAFANLPASSHQVADQKVPFNGRFFELSSSVGMPATIPVQCPIQAQFVPAHAFTDKFAGTQTTQGMQQIASQYLSPLVADILRKKVQEVSLNFKLNPEVLISSFQQLLFPEGSVAAETKSKTEKVVATPEAPETPASETNATWLREMRQLVQDMDIGSSTTDSDMSTTSSDLF